LVVSKALKRQVRLKAKGDERLMSQLKHRKDELTTEIERLKLDRAAYNRYLKNLS
jgi:hypothetical protein